MPLSTQKRSLSVWDIAKFSMLGATMFLSRVLMQWIPNIHLLALFIAAFTLTYRVKALIPLYIYILIEGMFSGFSMWWIPYLYIWFPLWGAVMLVSKLRLPKGAMTAIYMIVCGLHGLSFGVMYAPAQALMYGLTFDAAVAWVIAGLPFDIAHCIGDFLAALLVLPLHNLLRKLEKRPGT